MIILVFKEILINRYTFYRHVDFYKEDMAMANVWDAEHIVNDDLALSIIQDQFKDLNAQSIQLLGVGWDNTAYLINDSYVFRFPRRTIAVRLLQNELMVLPKIAPLLPLPIPVPKWVCHTSNTFMWPFAGYRHLQGKTADHANLSDEERKQLAIPIAKFLKDLHSICIEEFKHILPFDSMGRLNIATLISKIEINLQEIERLHLLQYKNKLLDILNTAHQLTEAKNNTLVHGDFYLRHLLIDDNHQLCGVIDWGNMHLGDPAIDFAIAHSFLPSSAHSIFKNAYGEIPEETWALARLRALQHSSLLVVYGHTSKDEILKREGLRSLNFIAQQIE